MLYRCKKLVREILFSVCFFIIGVICVKYFWAEQLQNVIKKNVFAKVIKYEHELLETQKECRGEKVPNLILRKSEENEIAIGYKELNNGNISRTFKKFHLAIIRKYEDENVFFTIYPSVISILWDDYIYGFYYSKKDKAMNAVQGGGECETEFEKVVIGYGKYWYRTEKIIDNWWYFEVKTYLFSKY